jgi:alanine-synthesizing transaminase
LVHIPVPEDLSGDFRKTMFSNFASKLQGEPNSLYRLRDDLRNQGYSIEDLVSGNINEHGFLFPQKSLEEILVSASRRCRIYRPDSFGQEPARAAVSEYYRDCGFAVDPECVLITPGTSLSYWYCFKLLADEGDEILCPCPSYPLFDYIAALSGVKLISYRLLETRNWEIDVEQLEASISTKTRALVLISPHNPTGHVACAGEIEKLAEVARRHNLAIISDEVFGEFLLQDGPLPRPAQSEAPLVFTLNGFSKMFALPGMKFGWIAVSGENDRVRHSLRSLEMISDTFLPVNEIVQAAAAEIFAAGHSVRDDFAKRIRRCWELAERALAGSRRCTYIKPEGGFYVPLRLEDLDEGKAAEALLRETRLLVHPGYFYDMSPDHLVLSFVQKPDAIRDKISKLLAALEAQAGISE